MPQNTLGEIKTKDLKTKVLLVITIFFTSITILRLFYLQVFNHKTLAQRAQYSTSKISILSAPRGIIFDRNGKIIATNKQAISVIAYPDKLKDFSKRIETFNILNKILKTDEQKLKDLIFKLPEEAPLPIRLVSNISIEEAIRIVEKQYLIPGIDIQEEPIRFYPHGAIASHVLGYISQIDETELSKRPDRKLGDLVGKAGIEKLYDDILRGIDGKDIVEVDRFGKPIGAEYKNSFIHIEPESGKNITLTLDLDLQKSVENALEKNGFSSCAVVVNSNSGEVLALASYPDFDPNIFTRPLSIYTWNELVSRKSFLNRAILAYVPGSIWKPITLIAALYSMAVKPGEKFNVSEAFYLGNTRFGDWSSKSDTLSLEESLAWSRDTAFYQIGRRLTPEIIKYWGVKLGGGRKTGIEILGEEEGIVPDSKWKKQRLGEDWYPGNTLHYAIGQSFLLITPLQAARIYSAIGNGSKIPKLQLIKDVNGHSKIAEIPETYMIDFNLLNIVKSGLEMCVDSGTGQASKLENVKVAGKTGSAEVPGSAKTHGWFVSYAPSDKPEITVAVFAERAGHGGSVAAPIAKEIFEAYFKPLVGARLPRPYHGY